MKINFTKKQYWDLMRAVSLGEFMANGVVADDKDKDRGIAEIYHHILSHASDFDCGEYVDYSEELGYHGNRAMDEEPTTNALTERYDGEVFWDELLERLAERDYRRTTTPELASMMSGEEQLERIWRLEDTWSKEFETYGLERFELRTGEENT